MKKRNIDSWKKALEWWIAIEWWSDVEEVSLIEEGKKIGNNEVIIKCNAIVNNSLK